MKAGQKGGKGRKVPPEPTGRRDWDLEGKKRDEDKNDERKTLFPLPTYCTQGGEPPENMVRRSPVLELNCGRKHVSHETRGMMKKVPKFALTVGRKTKTHRQSTVRASVVHQKGK